MLGSDVRKVFETILPDEILLELAGAERRTPPIHTQALALAMGSASNTIALPFQMTGVKADAEWDRIAKYLNHFGKDPNWRRSPSILDQLRGWYNTPGRPRKAKMASAPRVAN